MHLNDALLGSLLLFLAAALAVIARGFHAVPGQDYGASAFPTLIAAGFAGCGLVLIRSGLKERAPLVAFRDWTRSPSRVVDVLATIAAVGLRRDRDVPADPEDAAAGPHAGDPRPLRCRRLRQQQRGLQRRRGARLRLARLLHGGERDPARPCILGIVLGGMVEGHFITTMIRSDGSLLAFFNRPIAAGLGVLTILIWLSRPILWLVRRRRSVV